MESGLHGQQGAEVDPYLYVGDFSGNLHPQSTRHERSISPSSLFGLVVGDPAIMVGCHGGRAAVRQLSSLNDAKGMVERFGAAKPTVMPNGLVVEVGTSGFSLRSACARALYMCSRTRDALKRKESKIKLNESSLRLTLCLLQCPVSTLR